MCFFKKNSCWYLNWSPKAEGLHVDCVWMKSQTSPGSSLQVQVGRPRAPLVLRLPLGCSVSKTSPGRTVQSLERWTWHGDSFHVSPEEQLPRLCQVSRVGVHLLPTAHGCVTVSSSTAMWTSWPGEVRDSLKVLRLLGDLPAKGGSPRGLHARLRPGAGAGKRRNGECSSDRAPRVESTECKRKQTE